MGGFYGSIHIRTESYDLIKKILQDLAKEEGHKFYLAPLINGWISVFPEDSGQDAHVSNAIAQRVDSDVLHLAVHDDDIFFYWYYKNGKLIDEYNSCPDYFGEEISEEQMKRLKGKPEVFENLFDDREKIDEIRRILEPGPRIRDSDFPEQVPDEVKEFKILSEETKKFIKDPKAMQRFLAENPELFESEFKELKNQVLAQGVQPIEKIQKFLGESEKVWDIAQKLILKFIDSRKAELEKKRAKVSCNKQDEISTNMEKAVANRCFIDEKGNIQPPEGLFFARDHMDRFAKILGVSNAVTSYEYLAAGETDNIVGWEKFVEIS